MIRSWINRLLERKGIPKLFTVDEETDFLACLLAMSRGQVKDREDAISAALAECRRIEKDRGPATKEGLPNDIARAEGEVNAATEIRGLLERTNA
jgi:ABC-type Na+ transport system ATPase subunit NatA